MDRLKSDRGIHTLENYFKDMKYRGKGHEREDMDELMKRMEHWAHRLYPSYDFDDFISAVEKLGKKKELQSHMYRYRHDLLEPETSGKKKKIDDDEADEEGASNMQGVEPIDELDEIIDQQIENYTMMSKGSATPAHERTFDSIRSSMVATPRLRDQRPMEASTPIAGPSKRKATEPIAGPSWRVDNEPVAGPSWRTDPAPPSQTLTSSSQTLTSEQLARIAENRRLAQERLRQKKMELAAAEATKAVASTSLNDD